MAYANEANIVNKDSPIHRDNGIESKEISVGNAALKSSIANPAKKTLRTVFVCHLSLACLPPCLISILNLMPMLQAEGG